MEGVREDREGRERGNDSQNIIYERGIRDFKSRNIGHRCRKGENNGAGRRKWGAEFEAD